MNHHVLTLLPDSLAAYFGVLKVMVCVPYVFSKNKHIKQFLL